MTLHLTARDTAIAALKAYDEKRLSAQGPVPACAYMDTSGRPCAVGAGMPDAFARQHTYAGCVSTLVSIRLIRCSDEDAVQLSKLQSLHDAWASAADDGDEDSAEALPELEAAFVAYAKELAGHV